MRTSLEASTLQRIARLPAIGLAAAAIEKVMHAAHRSAAARDLLRSTLDEIWAWLASEKPAGNGPMTSAEARALPSGKLYYSYQGRLLELAGSTTGKLQRLLGGAFSNVSFVIWLVDQYERALNPGRPVVIGNDIAEVSWDQLAIGLRVTLDAADDHDEVLAWQMQTVRRLLVEHSGSSDPNDFGAPLGRDYFL